MDILASLFVKNTNKTNNKPPPPPCLFHRPVFFILQIRSQERKHHRALINRNGSIKLFQCFKQGMCRFRQLRMPRVDNTDALFNRRVLQRNTDRTQRRHLRRAQSRDGAAYVLEFTTAGGSHRLQYPKPAKGKPFAEGSVVTLYYDPDAPEKMFVEGDKSVLGAELLYAGIGVALLVLMVGIMNR